jgi:surfactin synthase thioesterase subunit
VPIVAYGGTEDPEVHPSEVDAWATQTTAGFASGCFPGGHFFAFDNDDVIRRLTHVLRNTSRPGPESGP